LVTTNPVKNLSLKNKGKVQIGADADLCFFDDAYNLTDVIARGQTMMKDGVVIVKGNFEK